MPAAVALLCVYNTNPSHPDSQLFFTYLDYLYIHQPDEHIDWVTTEKLIQFAKDASPNIPIDSLEQCIIKKTYQGKIEQNTAYGRRMMGGVIATPTLYVNGVEAKSISFEEISRLINEALGYDVDS